MVRNWYRDFNARRLINEAEKMLNNKKNSLYAALILTQLRNGTRVSETIEALQKYCSSSSSEVEVRVAKKKVDDYRVVVIPNVLLQHKNNICSELKTRKNIYSLKKSYSMFLLHNYNINSHSLRYKFITQASHVMPLGYVLKIIKHSNTRFTVHYIASIAANKMLREYDMLDLY